jgi:ribosome-binding factor A
VGWIVLLPSPSTNALFPVSNRSLRINELVQRELSDYLHRHYREDAVAITVTAVDVDDDLRTGRIHVGVIGTPEFAVDRLRWLRRHAEEIRRELGRRVILKWNPRWVYVLDESGERGARIQQLLDAIEEDERRRARPTAEGGSSA